MRAAATLAALAALVAPPAHAAGAAAPSAAREPWQEPEVAFRLAVAPGFGNATGHVAMPDAVTLQFPLQLDLGWRFGPFTVGGYGSWAPARGPTCPARASCSASAFRAGVQGTYAFDLSATLRAWTGLGTGWERITHHVRRGGADDATSYSGLEFLQAQVGLEWRLHRRLAVGPYLLVSAGRYTTVRVETVADSASASIPERAFHGWVHLGVRARVPLGGVW